MAKLLTGRASFDDLALNVRKAAALKAALELDVFTKISDGHRSLPAFCRASGIAERPARLLLDALANIGLLARTDFEYSLSPAAENFLVKGKPTFLGQVLLAEWAWEARALTARAVRTNKPLTAWLEAHQNAPRSLATWYDPQAAIAEFAPVWEKLELAPEESNPLLVLAFGVEAGLRSLSLVQKAKARLSVLDRAPHLQRLDPIVEALGLGADVEWLDGDWMAELPTDTFDLVFVDSITESRSIEENLGILHHAHETLKTGGWIVLRAAMEEDDRRGPEFVPLIGLDVLLGSVDGDVYTRTEYRGMIEAAGFFNVKPIDGRLDVWTARRLPPPPPPPPGTTLAPDFIPPPEILE